MFWTRANELGLNIRQKSMLRFMLDGFESKMTTSKWAARGMKSQISEAYSVETAQRFD